MFKLMKLELKKAKLGWYFKGAVIANLLIVCSLFSIGYIEKLEGNVALLNHEDAYIVIGSLVRATFIIFAAVLIAKLIIEEFRNQTISVLFSYPISRKQLLGAKLLIVGLLTFITITISHAFVLVSIFALNSYIQFIPGEFPVDGLGEQLLSILPFAFAAAGTSLISMYFGMRKYSVSATIISSILIVSLISSHHPVFSVASIVYIPLFLAFIGILIAVWTIRDIEKKDII